jgi:hypothetical protein
VTYLAAADYEYAFIPDLPCQYQRAAALNLWVGAFHGAESVAEREHAFSAEIAMSSIPRHCQGRAEDAGRAGWSVEFSYRMRLLVHSKSRNNGSCPAPNNVSMVPPRIGDAFPRCRHVGGPAAHA